MHLKDARYMKIIDKLKVISKNKNKEVLVKRYLLDCCEKSIRFRSSRVLPDNLSVARNYLRRRASSDKLFRALWLIEGEAFSTEDFFKPNIFLIKSKLRFYSEQKHISNDLLRIRISKGLTHLEAQEYLHELAYFIDQAFTCTWRIPEWFFNEKNEKFMCPRLFLRYFGSNTE